MEENKRAAAAATPPQTEAVQAMQARIAAVEQGLSASQQVRLHLAVALSKQHQELEATQLFCKGAVERLVALVSQVQEVVLAERPKHRNLHWR